MSSIDRSPILAFLAEAVANAAVPPRRTTDWSSSVFAFAVIAAILAVLAPALLRDPDTFWHVHMGNEILATGRLPVADRWSWTMVGTPWIAKEWLSQVVFALASRLGGWPAIALVTIVSVATAFALVTREALGRLSPLAAVLLVGAVFPLASGHVIARPHVLAWVPMIGFTVILLRAAESGRAPSLSVLPLMALWANLHGSFLLGLFLMPFFAADAMSRVDRGVRLRLGERWAVVAVGVACATLLHPYGFGTWSAAFAVLNLDGAGLGIAEWKAADFTRLGVMEVVMLTGIAALATTGRRIPLIRLALILALAHLALAHVRHMAIFGFLSALLLIEPIAGTGQSDTMAMPGRRVTSIACFLTLVAVVSIFLRPDVAPFSTNRPTAALAAARAAGVTGDVVNEYSLGGWLISEGVPTYIDGRTELFGAKRVADWRDAATLTDFDGFDRIFSNPRVGWTLLPPGLPAVGMLDRTPGWKRLYSDAAAVVHVRTH